MMKKTSLYLLCLLCVAGCTSSRMVSVDSREVNATFDASEEDIFYTAQQVLVQAGYPLARTERAAGTISTEPRLVVWREDQVGCSGTQSGTAEGQLKLSFAARVQQYTLTLWTHMEADHDAVGRAAICHSSGMIEHEMIEKIRVALGA